MNYSVKKFLNIVLFLTISSFSACSFENEAVIEKKDAIEPQVDFNNKNEDLPNTETWTSELSNQGELIIDLDGNTQDDKIILAYEEIEGERTLKDFYVLIDEEKVSLFDDTIEVKDEQRHMTLEDILAFDFNEDSKPEYVFLFDTHGAGGNGTHEVYILWMNNMPRFETLDCLDYYQEDENDNVDGGLDSLYKIQRVDGDNSKMKTYQYSYLNGHSDYNGDVVSIVGYDTKVEKFKVFKSWKEDAEELDENN